MSKVLITRSKLDNLAVAVSTKSGEPLPLTIDQMQTAVEGIQPGSSIDIPIFDDKWSSDWSTETITCDKTFAECLALWNDGATGAYLHSYVDDPNYDWESNKTITAMGGDNSKVVYVAYGVAGPTGDYIYHSNGTIEVVMPSVYAQSLTVTQNGYYYPQSGVYTDVTVNVPSGAPTLQTKSVSYTPSESQQTATVSADSGYDGLDEVNVTVGAISSTYVGSGISRKSSSDLTVSGATVTAPAGYYDSNASKSVASGSVTAPSSISGTSATVSTGTNTLTLTKTVSVTPNVTTAGYISSGTAGNSSVSLSASVTTQAAQTIYPSSSDQTISSGRYLTGAQTIKGVTTTNLTADNIKSGVTVQVGDSADSDRVLSVTGTYEGSGGSGLTLLKTTSLGTLSTSSTSGSDTGKTMTVTGYNDYDVLVVDVSVDSPVNGRHTSTVSFVILTGTSSVGTKNTYTVASNKWNSKLSSSGTGSTRQSTTAYGVYVNSASVSSSTMTLAFYYKYNNNSTGTLNGTYTARVYGLKLYDLIGG